MATVFDGSTKTPSLSWANMPHGTTYVVEVLEEPKLLHSRDFDTGQPTYWDEPKNTQPKMSAVINVRVLQGPQAVGEDRVIWASKPSNMFSAIGAAQTASGHEIAPGGVLTLRLNGERKHEIARMHPIKLYEAHYAPPTAPVFTPQMPPVAPLPAPPGMTTYATRPASWGATPAPRPAPAPAPGAPLSGF